MQDLPKGLKQLKNGTLGDLLLVIDMQNVYLPEQPWGCPKIGKAMENVKRLIDSEAVDNVIFTKYLPSDKPVGTWKKYNEEYKEINDNAWMSELIPECKAYAERYPVFSKCTYSSYENETVRELAGKAERVLIAGVVAECCVMFTLYSGIDAGDEMIYLSDACAGLDDDYEKTVEKMAAYYAPMHTKVMTCDEFIKLKNR